MASRVSDSSPFHGSQEGYARLFHVLTWVQAVYLLTGPWVLYLLALYRGSSVHGHPHAAPVRLLFQESFGLFLLLEYQAIYRRLSRRIRNGGPDFQFLDQTRLMLSVLAVGVPVLLIGAIISSSR